MWRHRLGPGRRVVDSHRPPISNVQTYVLDEQLAPVPPGVDGWLYAAGDGVARGYAGRSDLTAAQFVPNPFSPVPGARMYSTGDRARYLPDGRIDLLGRTDGQIKLRGHRIELGEIQAALQSCPGVADGVVLVRDDIPGEKYLAAYAVGEASTEAIRNYLKALLPVHMVPAAIEKLPELPLNKNLKLDLAALPRTTRHLEFTGFVAPAPGMQEALAAVWLQLLPVDQIGAHDNFFEIGGHSLLATRLVSRIRTVFRADLPLRSIFENPTIASLAPVIQRAVVPGSQPESIPVLPLDKRSETPLSFAQQRLWFLSQLEPDNPTYIISIALHLTGALNESALETSLRGLMERHEVLRARFVQGDSGPRQTVGPETAFTLQREDVGGLQDAVRRAAQEARLPFDLVHGPPLRVLLLRWADQEHALILSLHHIVCDGWSMSILLREWSQLYSAACLGRTADLSALPVQYADYAAWQRTWLEGPQLASQLDYWRERLAGIEPLELPGDRPRPALPTYRGGRVPVRVSAAVKQTLEQLSRQRGTTVFTTLLAAFQVLLHRYTGQADIAVGTPIAGRNRSEVEGLVGFFVNTLVLRTDFRGDPEFVELLERVWQSTLGAYSHQDIPFEQVVAELEPERSLSHSPLFQVMLVYQNAPEGELELPGLRLEGLDIDTGTSKFDLTLGLGPGRDGVIDGSLEYNCDLFEESTVQRMADHFVMLLEAIAAAPMQRISQLRMLGDAERELIVGEWTRSHLRIDDPHLPAAMWERQAERSPDRVAVVSKSGTTSYRALDRYANGIARRLLALGVAPEQCVGVCVERSERMVAAILGVWKAGAAWVPLDPAYPAQRLEWMVDDARLAAILCEPNTAARLPVCEAPLIDVDEIEPEDQTHRPASTRKTSRTSSIRRALPAGRRVSRSAIPA